jgi:hypothetical protein
MHIKILCRSCGEVIDKRLGLYARKEGTFCNECHDNIFGYDQDHRNEIKTYNERMKHHERIGISA